jgi:hypothetical protein
MSMTLNELLAPLERIGEGGRQLLDVRWAEEAEGSGRSGVGTAPPGGRLSPRPAPRRPRRGLRNTEVNTVVDLWLRIDQRPGRPATAIAPCLDGDSRGLDSGRDQSHTLDELRRSSMLMKQVIQLIINFVLSQETSLGRQW